MKKFLLLIFAAFLVFSGCSSHKETTLMEKLAIQVKDTSRAFSFTNKHFGQYYGETNDYFVDGWQGWTLKEQRIFNDYSFSSDGKELSRKTSSATVYPHLLKRSYSEGAEESFFFADSLDLILIDMKGLKGKEITFELKNFFGKDSVILNDNVVSASISNLIAGSALFITTDQKIISAKKSGSSLLLKIETNGDVKLALQVSGKDAEIKQLLSKSDELKDKKAKRIETLLAQSYVKTNNEDFDKALMWAKISLDALITEQDTKGIFAGLPWFNNYWGRDTFISLPGATFVTGNYKDARDILLSFAKYQDKNPASPNYGRIPNRITLKESIYNTADGTPWFVIQAYNYFNYTNDVEFLKQIYPSVKLAYDAAAKKHVDNNGFLMHADAETWMDAVGPNGPWSPRGNRAVDIQALWHNQLVSSSEIALVLKDTSFAKTTMAMAKKVGYNFEKFFLDKNTNMLYDRLKADGTPDKSVRPNAFFALNNPDLFSVSITRIKVLSNLMNKLVYPYGVATLSQDDPNFHPYHQYPPYYVKDAAYHNGIIWQWNFGPVVQSLCSFGKQDMAWKLTKQLTHQILHRGAAGTLAELMDALPRQNEKEPRLSGTFSQAWSLAEYIRTFYQDYLGIKPDANKKALYILPTIPDELNDIELDQKVGSDLVRIKMTYKDNLYKLSVEAKSIKDSLDLGISIMNKSNANYQVKTAIYKNDKMIFEVPAYSNSIGDLKVSRNGQQISVSSQIYNDPKENIALYNSINFAVPSLNKSLKALQGPGYDLLPNGVVKKQNSFARTIIERSSPEKDEAYKYPTNPLFKPGILDLTKFTLKEDNDNYYFTLSFRDLTNPGWHNEYGFQLTFASICIQTDDGAARSVDPAANSGYRLSSERAFNRLINVGGGFEVKDASGKILSAYLPLPEDVKNPLGNQQTKIISFAVPKRFIGKISQSSKITILAGAQDDHGGAGIGEFRNVAANATEWQGGGKKSPKGSNVFDQMLIN
ncbi:MAG: amylo-alpha-1,6-glucosidase [Bacteroidota bacterium]|nr:amylo-alpha-1,6-glucosidase [Bacteroidota bacterium]